MIRPKIALSNTIYSIIKDEAIKQNLPISKYLANVILSHLLANTSLNDLNTKED
ncbi:sulfite reductase subunit beta [Aphanothece sacrum FPU1]|uniref:Sulfite reductase subunit beta n=1 Tax=Aphanothece sacrum FPU1 TaxID=1920663 RepID=A0A401IH59_APHSA|nr:sulfite reductase subunit beta [Aphanothece sacrum FPU1]GBF86426.1 sulfite reductase [Aphanothece sacrum FPU3]GBF80635.1 sulfite reductase subunit beta [Aphanothece sacrum FPU1]GBF86429.1 sulfite reductase [Aphanothece sacrum FPU3]GBF86450.1 sulfite reductase [Aphanothece sacrum FPU3]